MVGSLGNVVVTAECDPMYGPAVRRKRGFDKLVRGLALMYPAFDWSIRSGPSRISARGVRFSPST